MDLLNFILLGVGGGLVLNIMPCVLPVLFFKISALIEHSDAPASEIRRDALAYTMGTVAAFSALTAVIVGIRAAGQAVGWGMQMQNPVFVAFLVVLLFVFGLSALGVFEFRVSVQGGGGRSGPLASFFDGALITLVSTPCSAPLLGPAVAFALGADVRWWETWMVFVSVGLGLALPMLVIGFVPGARRLLPKPGMWMETVKGLTGLSLMAAAAWLFGVLLVQIDGKSATHFLYFLVVVATAFYLGSRIFTNVELAGMWLKRLLLTGLVVVAGVLLIDFKPLSTTPLVAGPVTVASSIVDGKLEWTPFSLDVQAQAKAIGRPVFVDFTADWCQTCKVFEKTHINTEAIRGLLDNTLILAAKADLTRSDNPFWEVLSSMGRSGLPVYVIYKPDGTHELLPEGPPLTLKERLKAVGEAFPPSSFKQDG